MESEWLQRSMRRLHLPLHTWKSLSIGDPIIIIRLLTSQHYQWRDLGINDVTCGFVRLGMIEQKFWLNVRSVIKNTRIGERDGNVLKMLCFLTNGHGSPPFMPSRSLKMPYDATFSILWILWVFRIPCFDYRMWAIWLRLRCWVCTRMLLLLLLSFRSSWLGVCDMEEAAKCCVVPSKVRWMAVVLDFMVEAKRWSRASGKSVLRIVILWVSKLWDYISLFW
jgi:hypothetical protein